MILRRLGSMTTQVIGQLKERAREEHGRSLWKNFVFSIGMLAVAMIAALYSSSATRSGRMLPSAISAIIALAIAIWVGVRFVPRLAANVEWNWLPFLSQYQVTRDGWLYFGSIVVVIFAAISSNNNLLYMVLSAMMAVLLLSGFLSGINFRRVRVGLRMPETCYAGEVVPVTFEIVNGKAIFPGFSFSIESGHAEGIEFAPFYLSYVPARGREFVTSHAKLTRRGRYVLRKVRLLSRYPFGFFLKGKNCIVDAECICYPAILPQNQLQLGTADLLGARQRYERGLGTDLYLIRNYMPSDSTRHVHWKASAKTAALKTREYAAEDSRRVTLYLDRFGRVNEIQRFEELVSRAASLALIFIREGTDVALVTDEWDSGAGCTQKHLETILEYLALVERSSRPCAVPLEGSDAPLFLSLGRAGQMAEHRREDRAQ